MKYLYFLFLSMIFISGCKEKTTEEKIHERINSIGKAVEDTARDIKNTAGNIGREISK